MELSHVLSAATGALARLDTTALQKLEERALRLQALLASGAASVSPSSELEARHRVFASVVEATGENLDILERAGSLGTYGSTRVRIPWAR